MTPEEAVLAQSRYHAFKQGWFDAIAGHDCCFAHDLVWYKQGWDQGLIATLARFAAVRVELGIDEVKR